MSSLMPNTDIEDKLIKSEISTLISKNQQLTNVFNQKNSCYDITQDLFLFEPSNIDSTDTKQLSKIQTELISSFLNPNTLFFKLSKQNNASFLKIFCTRLYIALDSWTSAEKNQIRYTEIIKNKDLFNLNYSQKQDMPQSPYINKKTNHEFIDINSICEKEKQIIIKNNIKMIMRVIWRLNRCQSLIRDLMDKINLSNKYHGFNYLYDTQRNNKKLLYKIINAILLPCLVENYKYLPESNKIEREIEDTPTAGMPLKLFDEICKPLLNASNSFKRTAGLLFFISSYYKTLEYGGITPISKTEYQTKKNIAGKYEIHNNNIIFPSEGTGTKHASKNPYPGPFKILIIIPAIFCWIGERIKARIRYIRRMFSCSQTYTDTNLEKEAHKTRVEKRKVENRIISEFKKAKKEYNKSKQKDNQKDKSFALAL